MKRVRQVTRSLKRLLAMRILPPIQRLKLLIKSMNDWQTVEPCWASQEGFEGGVSQTIYKIACAKCVQQCKLGTVQIPASTQKLVMKTIHAKNCNPL